jgi:hypothetical protein
VQHPDLDAGLCDLDYADILLQRFGEGNRTPRLFHAEYHHGIRIQ